MVAESPCSSDDKADWKTDNKKWRGHTSSSSRDLSPWDDDEYRSHRSLSSHPDRHGFYMRHARRMNSCDDDYEYEDEKARRRDRRNNGEFTWYWFDLCKINFGLQSFLQCFHYDYVLIYGDFRFTKLVSSK